MGHRKCTWEGMRGPDTQYRDDGIRGPGTQEQRWALRKQRDATRGKHERKREKSNPFTRLSGSVQSHLLGIFSITETSHKTVE